MSEIEREEVERVARLARLTLSEAEIERLRGELEGILGHVDELPELDPADLERTEGDETVELRPDVPGSDALAFGPAEMAPDWRGDFFVVPRLPAMRRAEEGPGEDG